MLKGIGCVLGLAGSVLLQTAAWGQSAPQMRTRYFTSLSNVEVEQYLKRNDVIFVPVGTSESFGTMPNDMEYTMAEAYALKMAEEGRSQNRALSIGVVANVVDLLAELVKRGITPDVLTDQTSAHDLLNGYVPAGLSYPDEVLSLRREAPGEYVRRAR